MGTDRRTTNRSLDHRPVLVENPPDRGQHQADGGYDRAKQPGNERWAEDVNEQAIAHPIRLVARFVLQGIIENEELAVTPAVDVVADLDVDVGVVDLVDVVEDAVGDAQGA